VHGQRLVRVRRDLRGGLLGGGGADAAGPEHGGQLGLLEDGVVLQLEPFLVDLGLDQLVLRRDRHVLPGRHRARARGQPGQAGEHDGVRAPAATADPGDQRHVGDQPVHGAEHGRPQPAAGYVPVVVPVIVSVGVGPGSILGGHPDCIPFPG
jgi:hypothetical protein